MCLPYNTQGTTCSTEIYLSIREADLTVGQKKEVR